MSACVIMCVCMYVRPNICVTLASTCLTMRATQTHYGPCHSTHNLLHTNSHDTLDVSSPTPHAEKSVRLSCRILPRRSVTRNPDSRYGMTPLSHISAIFRTCTYGNKARYPPLTHARGTSTIIPVAPSRILHMHSTSYAVTSFEELCSQHIANTSRLHPTIGDLHSPYSPSSLRAHI